MIVQNDVTFVCTTTAAAIGSATVAYAAGDTGLFAVENGTASAVLLFTSAGNDVIASAEELTFVASANTSPATVFADYMFSRI